MILRACGYIPTFGGKVVPRARPCLGIAGHAKDLATPNRAFTAIGAQLWLRRMAFSALKPQCLAVYYWSISSCRSATDPLASFPTVCEAFAAVLAKAKKTPLRASGSFLKYKVRP